MLELGKLLGDTAQLMGDRMEANRSSKMQARAQIAMMYGELMHRRNDH